MALQALNPSSYVFLCKTKCLLERWQGKTHSYPIKLGFSKAFYPESTRRRLQAKNRHKAACGRSRWSVAPGGTKNGSAS